MPLSMLNINISLSLPFLILQSTCQYLKLKDNNKPLSGVQKKSENTWLNEMMKTTKDLK